MTEIFLTTFFISVLLFFLGSGIWVALSMIGVSAIERLEVLKGCNCEEYDQLKAVIAGKKSKY